MSRDQRTPRRPSHFDDNAREIPERFLEAAHAELPDADAFDVTDRAGELWAEEREAARDFFEEPD